MEKRLSQQIQDLIDLLQAAEQAEDVKQTLGAQLASLGLAFDQVDDDFAHLLGRLRHLQELAKRSEDDDAQSHGEDGTPAA
jgi:uncharacterized coiled-coil protein SlyX